MGSVQSHGSVDKASFLQSEVHDGSLTSLRHSASSLAEEVRRSDPRGFQHLTGFLRNLFCRGESAIPIVESHTLPRSQSALLESQDLVNPSSIYTLSTADKEWVGNNSVRQLIIQRIQDTNKNFLTKLDFSDLNGDELPEHAASWLDLVNHLTLFNGASFLPGSWLGLKNLQVINCDSFGRIDSKLLIKKKEGDGIFVNKNTLKTTAGVFSDYHLISRGDVVFVEGKKAFLACKSGLIQMDVAKAELLATMFPKGLSKSDFKQGNLGDCSRLSALYAVLTQHPEIIATMLSPTKVNLGRDGLHDAVEFNFSSHSLPSQRSKVVYAEGKKVVVPTSGGMVDGVRGDLGVRLFEQAFGEADNGKSGHEKDNQVVLNQGRRAKMTLEMLLSETHDVNEFRVDGNVAQANQKWNKNNLDPEVSKFVRLLSGFSENLENIVATASCGLENNKLGLVAHHNYAVSHLNSDDSLISLINPHDTKKSISISYEEFCSHFRAFTYAVPKQG